MSQFLSRISCFGGALAVAGLVATSASAADKVSMSVPATLTSFCLKMDMLRNPAFPQMREKYDLDIESVKMQVAQVPVTVSNQDLDIGECSGISTVVNAWNKGAKNLIIFAVGSRAPLYQIISKPEITKLEDLKGKSLGIPGLQSASTEAIEMILLRGAGMKPGVDYNLVSAGAGSARVAALMAGAIDALPTYPPDSYELAKQGYNILADEVTYVPDYVTGVHVVSKEWAEKNEALFIRVIKGMIETGQWLQDPANKDAVIAWLATNMTVAGGEPLGEDYAGRLYEFLIGQKRLSFNGYAPISAVRANLDIMKTRGYIKDEEIPPLGEVFDFSYLNKALTELGMPMVEEYPKQ